MPVVSDFNEQLRLSYESDHLRFYNHNSTKGGKCIRAALAPSVLSFFTPDLITTVFLLGSVSS
jgi:hypothetical protein